MGPSVVVFELGPKERNRRWTTNDRILYWPYSGDSGVAGVTAPIHDAGSFSVSDVTEKAVNSSLNLQNLPANGSVLFFDNPSPTHNYSLPGYKLLGYVRQSFCKRSY
ncbi:hypothetical protein C8R41DRAFT_212322 [Lentinula lateritia]|uniref:Uncharacterized protein n=1 Tax=Lentinula lateritia TaxID=40482 RepID=A0ABQ8VML5_9AGAR|nr:hypothetical protein C8R41DRAFT_212322 [Lentinula lateritia]